MLKIGALGVYVYIIFFIRSYLKADVVASD